MALTFNQFYNELKKKPEHIQGRIFEKRIKEFFLKSPSLESLSIVKVDLWEDWLYNDWGDGDDIGIDLVAETKTGDFIAIQCKFFNKKTNLIKANIEPLLAVSNKSFSYRGEQKRFSKSYLVTSCQDISRHTEEAIKNQAVPCTILSYYELENAKIDWGLEVLKRRPTNSPRPYQLEAIETVYKRFTEPSINEDGEEAEPLNKGKLIMACGTGKTFTSLKIIERLGVKQVLFLVPSLSLLGQTEEEFNQEKETKQTHLIVCSDSTIKSQYGDDPLEISLDIPATTDPEKIKQFLLKNEDPETIKIVFCTYQSLDKIQQVHKDQNIKGFDLVVCDEAHRTTGVERGGNWQKIHNQEAIRRVKTLFMTATPRVYTKSAKTRAKEQSLEVHCMDDKAKYGELFFSYYFKKAITQKYLSDYKVVILQLPKGDIKGDDFNFISHITEYKVQESLINFLETDKLEEINKKIHIINAQEILKEEIKTVKKEKIDKLICFSNSIKNSKKVTTALTNQKDMKTDHIDGTMTGHQRKKRLSWLKESSSNIKMLSNAQCLSEGVNIPSINGILFAEPKKSQIQVVQAVGRAIRLSKDTAKKYG